MPKNKERRREEILNPKQNKNKFELSECKWIFDMINVDIFVKLDVIRWENCTYRKSYINILWFSKIDESFR